MAWTFYKILNRIAGDPDEGEVMGFVRADMGAGVFERYDRLTGEFAQDPEAMAMVTGIGGAAGEVEKTTAAFVSRTIAEWQEDEE